MRSILLVTLGTHAILAGWFGAFHLDAALTRGSPLGEHVLPKVIATAEYTPPPPAPAPVVEAPDPQAGLRGRFLMTKYYVAEEFGRKQVEEQGEAGITIYDDKGCRPIATLSPKYVELLDIEGTGKLQDGRIINVTKPCSCGHSPCYRPVPRGVKWGISATMRPLQPFRTISVDPAVIKLGSMVYIAELDGLTMPGKSPYGGFVHDGCVIAADVGGGIDGEHVDFFVGKIAYKRALDLRKKMRHVTVYDGAERCADSRHWVAPRIGS